MVLDDSDDEIAFKVAENQVGQTLLTPANVCPKPDGDASKTIDDHEVSAAPMAPAESAAGLTTNSIFFCFLFVKTH